MNEEIIIDDVNVAECEFYDNGSCRECDMRVPFYSDIDCYDKCNKDCSYKQLKRLEQENARLKNERTADLVRQIDELKAENKRLKEDITQAHKDWEYKKNENYQLACRNEQLKEEISIAKENYGLEMEFQNMYRETLESVKEYLVVLENIIPTELLSTGSGVFDAINDAKKEINEVLR